MSISCCLKELVHAQGAIRLLAVNLICCGDRQNACIPCKHSLRACHSCFAALTVSALQYLSTTARAVMRRACQPSFPRDVVLSKLGYESERSVVRLPCHRECTRTHTTPPATRGTSLTVQPPGARLPAPCLRTCSPCLGGWSSSRRGVHPTPTRRKQANQARPPTRMSYDHRPGLTLLQSPTLPHRAERPLS